MAKTTEQLAQISGKVLDVCQTPDPKHKIACETRVCENTVKVTGEIITTRKIDFRNIVRKRVKSIGFDTFVGDLNCVKHESGLAVGNERPFDGHPGKICDRDSDEVLDACFALNHICGVVNDNMKMVTGEINVTEKIEYKNIVEGTMKSIGFESFVDNLNRAVHKAELAVGDERVSDGHPDRTCDQVYDQVLDDCLAWDPKCRVIYETSVKDSLEMVAGEINVGEKTNYRTVVQDNVESYIKINQTSVFSSVILTIEWHSATNRILADETEDSIEYMTDDTS